MTPISKELQELSDAASFTMVDMATWCECDKSAIREWMRHDVTPHPVRMKHLRIRLDLLRKAIKITPKLPVPSNIKQYDRVKYVELVRDYALKRISRSSSTGGRV